MCTRDWHFISISDRFWPISTRRRVTSTLSIAFFLADGEFSAHRRGQVDHTVRVSSLVSELVLRAQSTTKDYIRAEHKLTLSAGYSFHKSSYHKSCFLKIIFSLFIFRGHSTQEPASSRLTYFILRAYTGTSVSHSHHR